MPTSSGAPNVAGIFPTDAPIAHLVDVTMLEQKEEGNMNRVAMRLEGQQSVGETILAWLSALESVGARRSLANLDADTRQRDLKQRFPTAFAQ